MDSGRKSLLGRVMSDSMDKTVVVAVESRKAHPLYRKIMRRRVKLKAHDQDNACRVGDVVRIVESHPFSKTKHWCVKEIVTRGEVAGADIDDSAVQ